MIPPRIQRKVQEAREHHSDRTICEVMRVKLKVFWRPQTVEDTRDVDCPLRKISGSERKQPKRELTGMINKAMMEGQPKTCGTHISPPCTLDVRLVAKGI